MEQKLDPFYIKAGSANSFDILIVNSNNQMEFIGANALIQSQAGAEPPIHPFLLGGM